MALEDDLRDFVEKMIEETDERFDRMFGSDGENHVYDTYAGIFESTGGDSVSITAVWEDDYGNTFENPSIVLEAGTWTPETLVDDIVRELAPIAEQVYERGHVYRIVPDYLEL